MKKEGDKKGGKEATITIALAALTQLPLIK